MIYYMVGQSENDIEGWPDFSSNFDKAKINLEFVKESAKDEDLNPESYKIFKVEVTEVA